MMDRLIWLLVRRYYLACKVKGFYASPLSYADNDCVFAEYNRLYSHSVILGSSLGRFTYLSHGAKMSNSTVGGFCCIGPNVFVGGLGRHPVDRLSIHPVFYSTLLQVGITFSDKDYIEELAPVTIGNDVWIGAHAIILDGVNIGTGAVIGAGAVVTRDVEPYSIVGGVPARPIRHRFNSETIARFMEIKWWDWPVDLLKVSAPLLRSADISALEARADEIRKGV